VPIATTINELDAAVQYPKDVLVVVFALAEGWGTFSWCPTSAPVQARMAGALVLQQIISAISTTHPLLPNGGTITADRAEDVTPAALAASLKRISSEIAACQRRAAKPSSTSGADAEAEARRNADIDELSSRERALLALDQAEGEARKEFLSAAASASSSARSSSTRNSKTQSSSYSSSSSTNPSSAASSARASPATSGSRPASVGGFHVVDMPLSAEALDAVRGLSGDSTLLELAVDSARKGINVSGSPRSVTPSALADALCAAEPRFYLYRWNSRVLFVYWCPEGARDFKLRMVYSTAKGSVTAQLDDVGGDVARATRVEWSDTAELRASPESFLRGEMSASSSSTGASASSSAASTFGGAGLRPVPGGAYRSSGSYGSSTSSATSSPTPKARNVTTTSSPHPIYSLMGNSSSSSGKKKIVIPPRHAY